MIFSATRLHQAYQNYHMILAWKPRNFWILIPWLQALGPKTWHQNAPYTTPLIFVKTTKHLQWKKNTHPTTATFALRTKPRPAANNHIPSPSNPNQDFFPSTKRNYIQYELVLQFNGRPQRGSTAGAAGQGPWLLKRLEPSGQISPRLRLGSCPLQHEKFNPELSENMWKFYKET